MKNNLPKKTLVVFILDESGSMEAYKKDTIEGFNEYIETLQSDDKPTIMKLITFSTRNTKVLVDAKDVMEVRGITRDSYIPSGGTPLLDAIARGILDTDDYIEWSEEELDEEEQELESLKDILAHEFWRKIMRRIDGEIVYNLGKDYISYLIERYFDCVCRPTRPFKEKITVSEEPGENEYGGYWYRKGLEDSKNLRGFYEYLGYREDPRVHTDWRCFGKIPYVAMVKSL